MFKTQETNLQVTICLVITWMNRFPTILYSPWYSISPLIWNSTKWAEFYFVCCNIVWSTTDPVMFTITFWLPFYYFPNCCYFICRYPNYHSTSIWNHRLKTTWILETAVTCCSWELMTLDAIGNCRKNMHEECAKGRSTTCRLYI